MSETISLNPKPDPGISLEQKRPANPETIEREAALSEYAMGQDKADKVSLRQSMAVGDENRLNTHLSGLEAIEQRQRQIQESRNIMQRAAREGRDLTPEEEAKVLDFHKVKPVEPNVVQQAVVAEKVLEDSAEEGDWEIFSEEARDLAKDHLTNTNTARRLFNKVRDEHDNSSWARWGYDFLWSLVPGVTWSNTTNQIEGIPTNSTWTGENISQQVKSLYALSPPEFERRLTETLDRMVEDNIVDAMVFASAVISYSESDAFWDNAFFAMDVADVATLGATAAAGATARAARVTRKARVASKIKANAKALASPSAKPKDLKVVKGEFEEAATDGVRETLQDLSIQSPDIPVDTSKRTQDLVKQVPGMMDPKNYTRSPGNLVDEQQRRLLETLTESRDLLLSTMDNLSVVPRIDNWQAFEESIRVAKRRMLVEYPQLEDRIVEVIPRRTSDEAFSEVDKIEALLGDNELRGFDTPEKADFWARMQYKLGSKKDGNYDIVENAGHHWIRLTKTVDETDLSVRDMRINTENRTRATLMNSFFGWFRNPDNFLSKEQVRARKVGTYGSNEVFARMSEASKPLGRLGKNEIERLRTVMDKARFVKRQVTDPDGTTHTVRGKFYGNVAELEQAYLKEFNRLPTENETAAYFTFRQLSDYDYLIRNASMVRDKARQGIDQKSVSVFTKDANGKNVMVRSDYFEGRVVESLPPRGDNYGVAWNDKDAKKTKFGLSGRMFGSEWKKLEDALASGEYRIIQVADPGNAQLRQMFETGGENVNFVVVQNVRSKPLSLKQLAYNEGGHWRYPSGGAYLKQPGLRKTKFGRRIYSGDTSVHWFETPGEAEAVTKHYETARKMLVNNDPGLDDYVKQNLPFKGAKDFSSKFRSKENPEAPFSRDVPFLTTESGQTTRDRYDLSRLTDDGLEVVDNTKHNLQNEVYSRYSQERGEPLTQVKNIGTEANPVFKQMYAPIMDPLEMLSRSSSEIARARFYEDYKRKSIEDWVTEFRDVIDASESDILSNPMEFLRNPRFRKSEGTRNKVAAAKNSRRAILHLLNEPPPDILAARWATRSMLEKVPGLKGKQFLQPHEWDANADPSTVLRSSVFHAKLGLLNVVQFPLQGSAVLQTAAIDGNPIRAAKANFIYWAMRMKGQVSRDNVKTHRAFNSKIAKALDVNENIVEEAWQAYQRTGAQRVGGEFAQLDDYLNPKMFMKGTGQKVLDAGTLFFQEGNGWHRGVAFTTAFLDWKSKNPGKKLTNTELNKVIDRMDTLYLAMTRASNAEWSRGWASIPTQFFTFQHRIMESLLGTQLTLPEKTRMLMTNALMFGAPVAASMGVGAIWPVQDSIRTAALERGIDDENFWVDLFMNGVFSMTAEFLTGEEWDVSRYGPAGLSWLRDLTNGDISVAFGAPGNFISDMWATANPFFAALLSPFNGEPDARYQLSLDDFVDAFREVSSVNQTIRAYQIMTAGEWLSKDEALLTTLDQTPANAIAAALGLTPQEVTDAYLMLDSYESEQQAKTDIRREAMKWYERSLKAAANDNPEQAELMLKKSRALMISGGFTPLEMSDAYSQAMRDYGTMVEDVNERFMMQDPERRLDRYRTETLENMQ